MTERTIPDPALPVDRRRPRLLRGARVRRHVPPGATQHVRSRRPRRDRAPVLRAEGARPGGLVQHVLRAHLGRRRPVRSVHGRARAATGRVPSRGVPRIGPVRDMSYGVRQFIVVDPGGNYIRIGQPIEAQPPPTAQSASRLERALVAAVTLADSRSDDAGAAKVLDSAFVDDPPTAGPVSVRALVLRADVAHRLGDDAGAAGFLVLPRRSSSTRPE